MDDATTPLAQGRQMWWLGSTVALVGVAHLVRPDAFAAINVLAFGRHQRRHSYTNGAIETAIGLGLIHPRTRRVVALAALPYPVYLIVNMLRARRHPERSTVRSPSWHR